MLKIGKNEIDYLLFSKCLYLTSNSQSSFLEHIISLDALCARVEPMPRLFAEAV